MTKSKQKTFVLELKKKFLDKKHLYSVLNSGKRERVSPLSAKKWILDVPTTKPLIPKELAELAFKLYPAQYSHHFLFLFGQSRADGYNPKGSPTPKGFLIPPPSSPQNPNLAHSIKKSNYLCNLRCIHHLPPWLQLENCHTLSLLNFPNSSSCQHLLW